MSQSLSLKAFLFQGDLFLILLAAVAIFFSVRNKNLSCLIFSIVFLVALGVTHVLAGTLSKLPTEEFRFWWYQSFLYVYFLTIFISFITHAVLFIPTHPSVLWSYRLLGINIVSYCFMHFQRNEFDINVPNWTWDVYTIVVVSVFHLIMSVIIIGAFGRIKHAAHS
jgi:hypothetical protein